MVKARDYCCCAIPLVNAGIYTILVEQLVAGFLIGILSFATPSIVGAATPSFADTILGIICVAAGAIQILGFIGVAKEKPILFRRYTTLHALLLFAAFAVAGAWIAISAAKHSTAKSNCLNKFYPDANQKSQGEKICEIFPWVDVGIMGGIFVLLVIVQGYLYIMLRSYSSGQREDHAQYKAINDTSNFESIPINNVAWDSRPSTDYNNAYRHGKNESAASMSEIMNQPVHQPTDGLKYDNVSSYGPQRQYSVDAPFQPPTNAYTQDPGPTPKFSESYYTGGGSDAPRPVLTHPAEGSFGRKTPRMD